ncbi:MAG: hypothetical protein K6E97_01065 [Treponema sp.]|nr:hypothetical protein [Treponema sp.]
MKKTKILLSCLLAGLFLVSCGEKTPGKDKPSNSKVINVNENVVTINYENNTEDTQKFFVYTDENLGYNWEGEFEFYDIEKSTYDFGIFFDAFENEEDDTTMTDLTVLKASGMFSHDSNTYLQYKWFMAKGIERLSNLKNTEFPNLIQDTVNSTTTDILYNIINDSKATMKIELEEGSNKRVDFDCPGGTFRMFDKTTSTQCKSGYFLKIPAGSKCHLKLTISPLN